VFTGFPGMEVVGFIAIGGGGGGVGIDEGVGAIWK
jgi:hypothetical protein